MPQRLALVISLLLAARALAAEPRPRRTPVSPLPPAQFPAALDDFQAALEQRWAYLQPSSFDHRAMIDSIRVRVAAGLTFDEFIIELQKVIGRGIDGHASVSGWEQSLPSESLPFLIEPAGGRFVAFLPDRSAFVSDRHPFIESIDGRPIADWIKAADALVPDGSPQYVARAALELLRSIQFLRTQLSIERKPTVEVVLASDTFDRRTLQLELAKERPSYGIWPRAEAKPSLADIAYVRIVQMSDDGDEGDTIRALAAQDVKGLIIDVRDNGGGRRDLLRQIASSLMNPTDPPRVANVAVARLHPDHDADRMASRYLYPEDSDVWTADQRAAIAKFKRDFKPQWTPPRESYSDWHYMLLIPAKQPDQHFARPVVILMNAKCFSATDVFLSALKGLPNVTLLGTASGGGSANANLIPLGGSDLRVRLATMISFQRDGRLFDGNGVQPDIIVEPTSEFFIGGRDNQLDAAIGIIEKKSGVSNAGL